MDVRRFIMVAAEAVHYGMAQIIRKNDNDNRTFG
jgi:hypothetical protein